MKKVLLILGIILMIACVLSLLVGAFNLYGYYHVMDGSQELYRRLQERMVMFLITGTVLGCASIACLVIRSKM